MSQFRRPGAHKSSKPQGLRASNTPSDKSRRPVSLGVGHPRRRAHVLFVVVLFVFSVFAAQLLRIQGLDAQSVSVQALDSRLYVQTIPALRSEIVDSNGVVLASSVAKFNITDDAIATVTYQTVNDRLQTVGLAGAAQDIAHAIGGHAQSILTVMQQAAAKKSQFTYLAKKVTPQQWKAVAALNIPGVYSEQTSERNYPQGTALAPLLGWVDASGQPGGGVELMAQSALNGTPGKHIYEQSPDGTKIATGDNKDTPAINGQNVKLTIENDLQWYAQNAAAAAVKKYGALSADVVVMDKSQNLRAVASYPSFDNNDMISATGDLNSRAFDEVYEPGSTSKVITISALLQQGLATPQTHVVVPPTLTRASTTFHDAETHGTEYLTLAGVFAQSSNIGTMVQGEKLSPATIYSYMKKFGLGDLSGIGYPSESAGILVPYQNWNATQRYTILFGQGLASTAIQQASVFATIANGGLREPIKLIAGVGPDNDFKEPVDNRKSLQVVSSAVAKQVTQMMEGVVSGVDGTAKDAKVPGFIVAGKTGTADRYDAQLKRYNGETASFIGFAPANNPQYTVAVIVQRPTRGSIYGGEVAAPTFSQVMSYALQRSGVPPTGGLQFAPLPLTFDPSKT